MSSNRSSRALRALLIAALAASAAACASTPKKPPQAAAREGLTPTQQFANTVTEHPDQILLAPHPEGPSLAQRAALTALVERWREAGGGPIVIETPSHGGAAAYRAASAIQAAIGVLGVGEDQITLAGYEGDDRPQAPIMVGFHHFEAKGPACGRDWQSFTTNMSNEPNSNFGCAVTANLAAQVANPADLAQPRQMDPADAARRETVLTKYRAGSVTSSAKDDQADSAISDAVH